MQGSAQKLSADCDTDSQGVFYLHTAKCAPALARAACVSRPCLARVVHAELSRICLHPRAETHRFAVQARGCHQLAAFQQ